MKNIQDVVAFIYAQLVALNPRFAMPTEDEAKYAIARFKGNAMSDSLDAGGMADLVLNGLPPLNVEEWCIEVAEADADGCEETQSFAAYLLDHYNVPLEDR